MGFKGWPVGALEFFEGLEADNSKTYWTEHKTVYEEDVRAPMVALLAELAGEFGEARLFRPYRDVRFSADKSPYKTSIAAELSRAGYISVSADGLMVGAGMYHMAPDQLERYRSAVASDEAGRDLVGRIAELEKTKAVAHGTDPLKTTPKGYPKDHPRAHLLRYKGLVAMRQWAPAAWLGTAAAKNRVVEVLRASQPLCEWLDKHVGPSTMAPTRRR